MANTLQEKLGRRTFLASGVAAVGAVAATSTVANAATPEAKALARTNARRGDARYGFEDPDHDELQLLGLTAGMMVGPYTIERVAMREGAARIEAKGQGTQFRVDVLRRSRSPKALADVGEFSLYLCNHGSGNYRTEEAAGVGVLTLAKYLETAKPEVPEALMTYADRRLMHPIRHTGLGRP
ncbi:MAG: hypothetical protein AAF799_22105 [Myxococcota bacterium]